MPEITRMVSPAPRTVWDDALRAPALLDGLAEFREHLGGELTITLLRSIGEGVEVHDIREPLIEEAIGQLRPRAQ